MLSVNELRDNLMGIKGAMILTIEAETLPQMRKTDNPYMGTRKVSSVNGVINWVYEIAVNNQRLREDKEADFTAFPRKWGKRIKGTPLVEHKGKFYLEMKVQSAKAHYVHGDAEIDVSELIPYFYERSKSRQGVDKEVILRDYALENIRAIRWGGELLKVG
jgi:hypothetical protein